MKLRFRFELLLLCLLSLLLACRGLDQKSNSKLIYWSSNNQDEIVFAQEVVTAWNANHQDQPFHTQPVPEGQSSEEVILAAVVGKTTPDVYSNMWQGDVEAYAEAKKLIALDTLPGFMPLKIESTPWWCFIRRVSAPQMRQILFSSMKTLIRTGSRAPMRMS